MADETLTLNMPENLYQRQQCAAAEQRSLEEVIIDALVTTVPEDDGMTTEL
jgi:hypothetical protein